jgi:oxygen-independent coproporphyrinogen-3 oxidase
LVKKHFDFTYVKEFCVEAGRPDSITREKLEVLKKWGVDRISINPQSMQQKTLDLIGRRHSVEEIIEAFHLARETGHQNINMDIIIGLPGENPADVADTLTQIKALNPDSLTVHTLALKRAARLNIEKKNYADLKASEVSDMLEKTIHFAEENNYLPYYLYRQKNMADNLENIGYSRYGQEGLYNILIMEEQQTILALGAGGMSKFVFHEENRIERVDNVKSVLDYISRIEEMIARKQQFLNNNEVR